MGENEVWLSPNGLLPNESASLIRVLDRERWLKAEERTAELINCIQPNNPSEDRRNAVANYVQRLIMKCFPCQVFTFGSVPLKTYLPDGDIDLTAFSENQSLKDTWAHQVRDMLEHEEKNENAEFHVKEVQYIQAEVKIVKCLVENIVVDISFNQLGGLCTLCFLEEVDNLINQDHLFKRSIILIKAWCYYESRILGAHHGLISTYALETLVLYIFHVYNTSFAGPLEVLYRFLEFFSKFDWDNFCVSLWGPVPISSLPDVTAEPPRKDRGELLLSKLFDACSTAYAVFPTGQENQGQPFMSKHFNVIDPLRINNNLGRSVSKGNFFRIRSAFALGAKKLARLLDCPMEDLGIEVNHFFMNTWGRHGSGSRPDAPKNDLWCSRLSSSEQPDKSETVEKNSSQTSVRGAEFNVNRGSQNILSQHGNNSLESISSSIEVFASSQPQNQRSYINSNNTKLFEQNRKEIGSNQATHVDRRQRSSKAENLVNDLQGRYIFVRTSSSPELTGTYGEAFSQGRRNIAADGSKGLNSSVRLDHNRKNIEADNSVSHGSRPSSDEPSLVRHYSPRQNLGSVSDVNNFPNTNHDDAGLGAIGEVPSAFATQEMRKEQDLLNMMASSTGIAFDGQGQLPLNLSSNQMPMPIPPAVLASMGYAQQNMGGMVPTDIPMMNVPWGSNIQFPQSLVPPPFAHYISRMGLLTNPDDAGESGNEKFGSVEMNAREADQHFWHERERIFPTGFELDNESFEIYQSDDKQQSSSITYNSFRSSQVGGSGSSPRVRQKSIKETQGSMMEDHVDNFQFNESTETEVCFDDRNSISRPHTGSLRSRTSSESSWEGSSTKSSKPTREKSGRKPATSSVPAANYAKGKNIPDHSSQADDDKDWNSVSNVGLEIVDGSREPQSAGSLHLSRRQIPGFEPAQTSGSESLVPMAPILLASDTRQRNADNSGVLPIAFYPTGPPVPFVTMVPIYNFPNETGTSDASRSQFSDEEGLNKIDFGQTTDSSEAVEHSEESSSSSVHGVATVEPLEQKSDILNGDFANHLQNLQYGRFCQTSQNHAPMLYPSPFMVPPVYAHGHLPWDGLGRSLSTNMNLFSQLMSYGPHIVPVAPLRAAANRPNIYQPYVDEMPRYRGGTGTYLPNPKVAVRDRHPANSRKGNYNYDRNVRHGDREGNWNSNPKTRPAGRSYSRNQAEKSGSRFDRLANESQVDRTRSSLRHEAFPSHRSQNGPIHSSMTLSGSSNVAHGMYPLSSQNPGGGPSNGPTIPSVVMLYPYDQAGGGYGSAEQLEFGSLGPVTFSHMNQVPHVKDGNRMNMGFEDQRMHGNSVQMSSPDQPSSPHLQRGI